MITVVESESAIRRYHRQLLRSLKGEADRAIPVELGHPGASVRVKVFWSERLGIWFFSRKIADHRHWNAFGVGKPEGGQHIPITCEINFPLCGIDRRTGGAFAEDGAGRAFVIHRGKLGGGRKGVGKGLFENSYRGAWAFMGDGSGRTPVAVIGVLDSPRLARQIAQFVRRIARIKQAASMPAQAELIFQESAVREELIGDGCPAGEPDPEGEVDLGLLARDLAEALGGRRLLVANDGDSGLLASDRQGRPQARFQIVPNARPEPLLAAAARLLLDGAGLPGGPAPVLVLPAAPAGELAPKLERHAIRLLVYEWQQRRAIFPGLDACLPQRAARDAEAPR